MNDERKLFESSKSTKLTNGVVIDPISNSYINSTRQTTTRLFISYQSTESIRIIMLNYLLQYRSAPIYCLLYTLCLCVYVYYYCFYIWIILNAASLKIDVYGAHTEYKSIEFYFYLVICKPYYTVFIT